MYIGQGDQSSSKSNPNSQQSSHILNDPVKDMDTGYKAPPRPTMHQNVMAFERKLQYDNLVRSGYSPGRAAQRVGKNISLGKALTPKDIEQIINTGTLPKRGI